MQSTVTLLGDTMCHSTALQTSNSCKWAHGHSQELLQSRVSNASLRCSAVEHGSQEVGVMGAVPHSSCYSRHSGCPIIMETSHKAPAALLNGLLLQPLFCCVLQCEQLRPAPLQAACAGAAWQLAAGTAVT